MSEVGANSEVEVVRILRKHHLSSEQGTNLLVIHTVVVTDEVKNLAYPYMFNTNYEVPATLVDTISSRYYACDSQAMIPFSTAKGSSQGHYECKYGYDIDITEVQHRAMSVVSRQHVAVRGLNLNNFFY